MTRFKPVDSRTDFVKQEEAVLSVWEAEKIFQRTLQNRVGAERFVFFEGPPTANAKPGLHHALARYFKDVIPRYKTMRGFLVERKAGWDTHGLPVEIAVEKELGLTNKNDIERYGVAEFNKKARENVWQYKELWEKFTNRIGYWVDMEDPYITYDPKYIESVWWILKQIWEKELLYKGHKVVPFCPRCGTALSSHEVAQGYQEVEDASVYVKFKLNPGQTVGGKELPENSYVVAWTTTPWTLPGNVGLAVNEKFRYILAKVDGDYLVVAEELAKTVLGEEFELISVWDGADLLGLTYEPVFAGAISTDKKAWYILPADFVTLSDGTGVVHTAVMYGEDDYALGEQFDLPRIHTVNEDGSFMPSVVKWAGKFVKDKEVEAEIIADLEERGLLLKTVSYKHEYPFCWRCGTPLLYYATDSWFIAMSKLRGELAANNQKINWVPEHIKDGRFGEWVKEAKDWAISRNRYWGTPLPLWVSEEGEVLCIGSYEELKSLATEPELIGDNFDPHRPTVDKIILEKEGKKYTRVPEVLDVWFDSGAMPYAQWHYPFENKERIEAGLSFPADYISEAIDQTRGWFYTLLAVSTAMGKSAPYRNVICLGHILDKYGKKMSKSKGNVIDPWEMFDKYGSDVIRWHFFTLNQPGLPKNFDEEGLRQVTRRFVLTLWNTYSFFVMYANIDSFNPDKYVGSNVEVSNILDRWILARRDEMVQTVTEGLDDYEVMRSCGAIEEFVNDLSNWYVRRSRRRFWKNEDDNDKTMAEFTLWSVLTDVTKVLAPFMPFLSEAIYQNLKLTSSPSSVHLVDWPVVETPNAKVLEEMKLVRALVEEGLNLREVAKIKVRQPLQAVSIGASELANELQEILKEELNVKEVILGSAEIALDTNITEPLAREGLIRELVRNIQVIRKDSGFEVQDRIRVEWRSEDTMVREAVAEWMDYLKMETLAVEVSEGETEEGTEMKINDRMITVIVQRVEDNSN